MLVLDTSPRLPPTSKVAAGSLQYQCYREYSARCCKHHDYQNHHHHHRQHHHHQLLLQQQRQCDRDRHHNYNQ